METSPPIYPRTAKRPPTELYAPHGEEHTPHGGSLISFQSPFTPLPRVEWDDPRWLASRSGEFFRSLPDRAMSELASLAAWFSCQGNTVLFAEEQPPRAVFLLLVGRVKLCMNSIEGRRLILGIVGPGEILGLTSAISGAPHGITAETQMPCVMASVHLQSFLDFLLSDPVASQNAARQLSLENRRNCEQLRTVGLAWTAAAKLSRLLLEWCGEGRQTDRGIRFLCPLTHEEIAEHIGVSRETVTRTLHGFRNRKLVEQRGAALFVSNLRGLEIYAQASFPDPMRTLAPPGRLPPDSCPSPAPAGSIRLSILRTG
ncbi:MAG: Crp/Fnr family transcriptional regulator [Acidobacteriaceae bacterium]